MFGDVSSLHSAYTGTSTHNKSTPARAHKDAANRTYDIIAPDLFRTTEDNTLNQAEVILYAGRYIDYGNDPEAAQAFNTMSDAEKTTLLQEVFPEQTYHWEQTR